METHRGGRNTQERRKCDINRTHEQNKNQNHSNINRKKQSRNNSNNTSQNCASSTQGPRHHHRLLAIGQIPDKLQNGLNVLFRTWNVWLDPLTQQTVYRGQSLYVWKINSTPFLFWLYQTYTSCFVPGSMDESITVTGSLWFWKERLKYDDPQELWMLDMFMMLDIEEYGFGFWLIVSVSWEPLSVGAQFKPYVNACVMWWCSQASLCNSKAKLSYYEKHVRLLHVTHD